MISVNPPPCKFYSGVPGGTVIFMSRICKHAELPGDVGDQVVTWQQPVCMLAKPKSAAHRTAMLLGNQLNK